MNSVFAQFERQIGTYVGGGINHEGQPFDGVLTLTKGINSFSIHYKASGNNGELFHEEQTTIALDEKEKLCLWSVNTNNPVMLQHHLRESEAGAFIFGYQDKENKKAFREEIALILHSSTEISYEYSWGLPGGDFAARSKSKMVKR